MPCCTGAIGGGELYGDGESNSVITYVTCLGNESSILECSFNKSLDDIECGDLQDAHVICQGMTILNHFTLNHVCI